MPCMFALIFFIGSFWVHWKGKIPFSLLVYFWSLLWPVKLFNFFKLLLKYLTGSPVQSEYFLLHIKAAWVVWFKGNGYNKFVFTLMSSCWIKCKIFSLFNLYVEFECMQHRYLVGFHLSSWMLPEFPLQDPLNSCFRSPLSYFWSHVKQWKPK